MSERGTYITDYIYCKHCLSNIERILNENNSNFNDCKRFGMDTGFCYGRIGGLYPGEELDIFEYELLDKIKENICHDIKICIFSESGKYKVWLINGITRRT